MSKAGRGRPAAAGTYRVLVRDLVLAARIGVWKREKNVDQRVRVNVELLADRAGPLVAADGLIELPEDLTRLEAGAMVEFLPFSESAQ